jgi:DUF971 family protein
MSKAAAAPWPQELVFRRAERTLDIAFDDGARFSIPFELLRVESPSAETRGHGGAAPPPPAGKKSVGVAAADPVGRYAVRIQFDDGHDTGLYSWELLYDLGRGRDAKMGDYLQRLRAAGLSR